MLQLLLICQSDLSAGSVSLAGERIAALKEEQIICGSGLIVFGIGGILLNCVDRKTHIRRILGKAVIVNVGQPRAFHQIHKVGRKRIRAGLKIPDHGVFAPVEPSVASSRFSAVLPDVAFKSAAAEAFS